MAWVTWTIDTLPVSVGCQEQVAYVNYTRSFLGASTYTASDNALCLKSGLALWDYSYVSGQSVKNDGLHFYEILYVASYKRFEIHT